MGVVEIWGNTKEDLTIKWLDVDVNATDWTALEEAMNEEDPTGLKIRIPAPAHLKDSQLFFGVIPNGIVFNHIQHMPLTRLLRKPTDSILKPLETFAWSKTLF